MSKKYNIGIIGAGNIGSALAKHLVALGHSVVIANSRGPQTLIDVEKETGAKAVQISETIKDIVIVTIPFKNIEQLPKDLFRNAPKDLVIIDTNNYYPGFRDAPIESLDKLELTHSEWVSKTIGRSVVKVFNNISTYSLKFKPSKDKKHRVALPIAGDDEKAKAIVFDLVEQIGFDPVDAGSLKDSWRQHPGTPSYGCDYGKEELQEKLKQADQSLSLKKLQQAFVLYGQAVEQFNKEKGKEWTMVEYLLQGGEEFNDKFVDIQRSLYQ
ncbi:predicted protein [Naegleria gruberi]|uniref:Predicted protein n=1 Tax=Naegleria gruberi TaxID=5762 RepID=D2VB83_NAEGR|nr:uncharacterized protein NAEGRDRAFT_66125 [Naegleria gruberi]EFC45864.1 predicted protein [Naegleria gruberi]|eukprot:XP_002678608.1 predicted protein [Naegleria gruberi strain NEG-M]